MAKRQTEPYNIVLGANSDPENLAKLSKVYCMFKAKMILRDLEEYPEEIRAEVLKRMSDTA